MSVVSAVFPDLRYFRAVRIHLVAPVVSFSRYTLGIMKTTRWPSPPSLLCSFVWLTGCMSPYSFKTPVSAASAPADAAAPQAAANSNQKPPDLRPPDAEGWEAIRGSDSPALFEQFLKEYPDSQYAGAARLKLAALRSSKATPATSSPSPGDPTVKAPPPPAREVQPAVLRKAPPEYSEEARVARLQGNVFVNVLVDERGQAQDVQLIRGLGLGLDRKAIDAVRQWQFQPGTRAGVPARFSMAYEVEFRLPEAAPWRIEGVFLSRVYEQGSHGIETKPELQRYVVPEASACTEKGGYVVVQLGIDNKGSPRDVKAVTAPSASVGESAVTAVQSWMFKPALLDQKPKPAAGRILLACEGPGFSVVDSDRSDSISRAGNGVSQPALIFKLEPEYSEEARKQKHQGVAVLQVVIDQMGRPNNIKVIRSLGLGLDEKAAEALSQWRFKPGMKGDKPVAVTATVEVNFQLL